MLKIAITGNIASGKSLVEKFISNYYPVYDTDQLAHEVLDTITEFYAQDVFTNGNIDRKKLGDLVFKNSEYKAKLEEMIHPKIMLKLNNIFEANLKNKFIFVSVPLLYETDFYKIFDKVLFVSSDENIRLERLMRRNDLSEEDARLRIASQLPENEKINRADYVIKNNSTINALENSVKNFLEHLSEVQ